MRHVPLILALLASLALQPLLNERLGGAVVAVQLPLLVAALAMFATDGAATLLWTAAAGFVSDCLSPAPLGVDMLAATVVVFVVRRVLGGRPAANLATLAIGPAAIVFCVVLISTTARSVVHHVPIEARVLLELTPDEHLNHLAFSPDGRLVAGSESGRTIFVWDAHTGAVRRLPGHFEYTYNVAFGVVAGRLLLASVSTAGEVRVWDPLTGASVKELEHEAATAVAFSPDGRRMVTTGWDRVVRVWDTASWELTDRTDDPTGGPNAVTFSPDGLLIAWGGVDSTVKVWRPATRELATLRGHRNWVWDVEFTWVLGLTLQKSF